MFIQTEALPDPDRLKFIPGETVLPVGSAEFPDEESAERSPLAERLFGVDGVAGITLHADHVVVEKDPDLDWMVMKPMVLGAIMDHYTSGAPVMHGMEAEAPENAPAAPPPTNPSSPRSGKSSTPGSSRPPSRPAATSISSISRTATCWSSSRDRPSR